ncbi:MAG: hypothetical protein R3E83_20175 [Burkholderiaceae bacterium]
MSLDAPSASHTPPTPGAIMRRLNRLILSLVSLALGAVLAGCSMNHTVKDDYPQYLQNNIGASKLPKTGLSATYELTPATATHKYEFRSAMAGYANNWVIEFGELLDATLRSQDVQQAFAKLDKRAPSDPPALLVFDLASYTFEGFSAHVDLNVTIQRPGAKPVVKNYKQTGVSQGGKMFWAGVFGMKNAIQQSTKNALDKIMASLLADLNAMSPAGQSLQKSISNS